MTETPGRAAWWWALGGLVVVLAVVLVIVLATRDDGDSSTAGSTSSMQAATTRPATTLPPPTTVLSTTPTSIPATTRTAPSTTVALPVITDDPQTYAEYLFAAWRNGDRVEAARVASTDAVTQMFALAYPAQGPYTFGSCGPAAGSLYCTWNGQHGATIQMQVRTLTGGLPIQVRAVTFAS